MKQILFNTEMVKAILEGRKTQTRRVINYGLYIDYTDTMNEHSVELAKNYCDLDDCSKDIRETFIKYHGKYKVDDVLCVSEKFQLGDNIRNIQNIPLSKDIEILYYENEFNSKNENNRDFSEIIEWTPAIYMPKRYARIFLKVTNVRVERLQDISSRGYISEGFDFTGYNTFTNIEDCEKWWINLWNSTAKDGYKWEDNPYVFVYKFERIENKDLESRT